LNTQVELFSDQLAPEQERLILERTEKCIKLANRHYGLDLDTPTVTFNVKGTAWGYYMRRGKKVTIRFNPLLFARYFQEGLQDTVPHEVAHYVVDSMYTGPTAAFQLRLWLSESRSQYHPTQAYSQGSQVSLSNLRSGIVRCKPVVNCKLRL